MVKDKYNELQGNIVRFETALTGYATKTNPEEKAHCKDVMRRQVELMGANVQEINRSGIHKQWTIVASHFEKYMDHPKKENFTALQQVTTTLKEYSLLPHSES